MFIVLGLGVTLSLAGPTWAGPYLFRSIEKSVARSTNECRGQVVKVLRNLQSKGKLKVDKNNKYLGATTDSTAHVDCIFVGKNERRRDSWVFYIAIASTNRQESQNLLKLLRLELGKFVRID